ncbi:MAG TPA: S-methyl-5-thioribose-1-phosphate isomerase [Acidimicrobiia bacterium]|jgi:methylthioribose-1-phosphate isomerase|nr:S-methyl-5-thioribose-1-phosphate isomerase [Acidimicrobiia bacterium]
MKNLGGRTLDWLDDAVVMVDQTRLPESFHTIRISTVPDLVAAIRRLSVRGAPAIGVAGGFGVALAAHNCGVGNSAFDDAVQMIRTARPTAVNLARMVDRVASAASRGSDAVLEEALAVRDEELAASELMGIHGAELVSELSDSRSSYRVLTICNTGGLASVERGTALAVVQTLHERAALEETIVLETRPLLQGARLTTWELQRMGAPHRLVVDGAGPYLISRGVVDAVLVGADRIAANGDTANKVGTFSLALAAQHAGVPFIVVAPESTIDMATPNGEDIEIEYRDGQEVVSFRGTTIAPKNTEAINPAFDLTPVGLITAIVTDKRVVRFDRGKSLDSI